MGILPGKKNVPISGLPKNFKAIIEGKSKVGKTKFSASFPNALIIECEPGGAAHVDCHVLDLTKGKKPLDGLRMAIEELREDTTFLTVVLDTIDAVAEMVSKEICAEMKIASISEPPKDRRLGIQWEKYAMTVTGIVSAIIALPKNVIVLGHTKPASYDDEGVLRSPEGLDIYGKAARILYARVDNIGHMSIFNDGGELKHMLSFRGGMDCTRGSRHPALHEKEIIVPKENGYAVFEKLFTEAK